MSQWLPATLSSSVAAPDKDYSRKASCQSDVPKSSADISMATHMPSAGIDLDPVSGPSRFEVHLSTHLHTEEKMPLFITYASYSNAGMKGIVDKPTDRTEAIQAIVEKAGGKLLAAYMTTGPHDVVVITEQADGSDAVAVGMVAAASGAVARIETVRAWPLGEFKGVAEKARKLAEVYVPPGR